MGNLKHSMTTQIIGRCPNVWRLKCGRHAAFTGSTYEAVEDQWREHVYAAEGLYIRPLGDKTIPRWEPSA